MADVLDIIHRFSYQIQGADKIQAVEQQFARNAEAIARNTQSLQRLQTALAQSTNPAQQDRIRQAIQNRTEAIRQQGAAIQNTIINDRNYQQTLQREIGILNELGKRLETLRQARQRATSAGDIDGYNRQIREVEAEQRRLAGGGNSALGGLGSSLLQGVGLGVGVGGVQALGSAVGYIKDLVKESFLAAANFDQLRVAFGTLLQSQPKANQLLQDITKFAAETPFGTEQLSELSKQLIAFGFNAEEIVPTLNEVGNIAAGVGSDKLPQIVLALGQIRSAGKLTGQDLLQLINAGFNPLQEISERTGVSYAKLKTEMEKGQLTFARVKESFKAATSEGGKFFNLMQKQALTVSGQLDRLGDSVDLFKRNIGGLLQDVGADFIGFIGDVVEGLNEWMAIDPASEIRKEQLELNTLVNTLIELNDNNSTRNQLISELRQQYPDFLGKLSNEQITTGFLASRLADVNNQYQRRIELIGLTIVREGILEKRRENAGAQVNASTVRGALQSAGIDAELDNITGDQLRGLSDEERSNIVRTLRASGRLSGAQTLFGTSAGTILKALKETAKLEREAISTNEGIDKAYMDAEKRENDAVESGKKANAAQIQRYKDELSGAKKAEQILKQLVQSGKANAGQLAEYDTVSGRIADLENLITVKQLEGQAKPTVGAETATEKAKKGRTAKPKTAEQLANEAYKNASTLIETEIGNARNLDKRLKELRDLQLRNEQAYTNYVNSDTFQSDSKAVRSVRELQYKGIAQSLAAQIKGIDITFDIAEIQLKIDAATKLKREPEKIKLIEDLVKKELEQSQIRVEIPIELGIDPKEEGNWAMKSQKAFNDAEQERLKKEKEDEEKRLKERKDAYTDMYKSIFDIASSVIDSIYGKQIQVWDNEIAYRQYTVERATVLAERGNTEELAAQEKLLTEAMAQREASAQRQIQLNAILQASNMAVALSEAIGAIVSAAAKGDPYTIAARVVAAVAALVGGVAALSTAFSSASTAGFADGVIDLQGAGTTKSDSIPARLSRGESVMTAEATAKYKPILEQMQNLAYPVDGRLFLPMQPKESFGGSFASSKEMKSLRNELVGIKQAIYDTEMKAENKMDGNGVSQLIQKHVKQDRRRWR